MEIIEKSKTHSLAELISAYRSGKTVIYDILKRKEKIKSEWSRAINTNCKQFKKCVHENVNKALHDWYLTARAQNLPVSRMILLEKARKISTLPSINDTSFKASNGWLLSFMKRYGITFGEARKAKQPRSIYFSRAKSKSKQPPDARPFVPNVNQSSINGDDTHPVDESCSTTLLRDTSRNKSAMSYREILNSLNDIKSSAASIGNEALFSKIFECITMVEKEIAAEAIYDYSKNITQTGTFKLVKTIERNGSNVCAVPENWEKDNILYWPAHLSHPQQEKLRSDSGSKPNATWTKQNCVTKIQDIGTFIEALQYEKQLTETSAQTKMEEELRAIRFQNDFLVEKFKSFEKETQQHFTSFDSKLNVLMNSCDFPSTESGETATYEDYEIPMKIEHVMMESSEEDNCNSRIINQLDGYGSEEN